MPTKDKILVKDSGAARLLDISVSEFRGLVEEGYLPKPRTLGPSIKRWCVRELEQIATGEPARQDEMTWQ